MENAFSQRAEDDGIGSVMSAIDGISQGGPKVKNLTDGEEAYASWLRDKTPENMSAVISAYMPTINSELTRYSGPSSLLRSKAKVLAVNAVKTFNPMSGARLSSWIVTNMKPLSRYSMKQRDVSVPEVAFRQAAAVDAASKRLSDELGREPTDAEISDELGIPEKRVSYVRSKAVASVGSGKFDESEGDESVSYVPGVSETDKVQFAEDAVYNDLSDSDKFIFDSSTGSHGSKMIPAIEVARRLGVSPAAVSQRAKSIGEQISYVVENG